MTLTDQVKTTVQDVSILSRGGQSDQNSKKPDIVADKETNSRDSQVQLLRRLKEKGQNLRADLDQPNLSQRPPWFDEELFRHVKSVYERHFMGINFAHLSGLLLLVRVDSIYRTLSQSGGSETVGQLFKRYYHTVKHVKTWYEGDIFKQGSEAHRSLLTVRGMHNKVSSKLNGTNTHERATITKADLKPTSVESKGAENTANGRDKLYKSSEQPDHETDKKMAHISQYDILITQFAFVGFVVTKPKSMGLIDDFSTRDMESFLHFWRVIGYYLGAKDDLNLCSYNQDQIHGLCEAIIESEYRESITRNRLETSPGIMSLNIIRSVKFIPMLTFYGMMRYLYELLDVDIDEIADRKTWYSSLSYTLIKLVMSNLLAYRPFRSFNNGLTRLSVYLVGKVEDWFANHLESKYGQELRL